MKMFRSVLIGLIATIVGLGVGLLLVEAINLSISGFFITEVVNTALEQSCILYSQETYKRFINNETSEIGGTTSVVDIYDRDNNFVLSGDFYPGLTAQANYDDLYTNSSDFKNWLNTTGTQGNWKYVNLLKKAIVSPTSIAGSVTTESREAFELRERLFTPVNIGIPYLDKYTTDQIFKWSVTRIFSQCNNNQIETRYGRHFVHYLGFKIYTTEAEIDSITYKVYNLSKLSEREEFKKITNIDPLALGTGSLEKMDKMYLSGSQDARERVCIASIKYRIPIEYEGITSLRRFFTYINSIEVEGLEGDVPGIARDSYNEDVEILERGGLNSELHNETPVPGQLIYHLVR